MPLFAYNQDLEIPVALPAYDPTKKPGDNLRGRTFASASLLADDNRFRDLIDHAISPNFTTGNIANDPFCKIAVDLLKGASTITGITDSFAANKAPAKSLQDVQNILQKVSDILTRNHYLHNPQICNAPAVHAFYQDLSMDLRNLACLRSCILCMLVNLPLDQAFTREAYDGLVNSWKNSIDIQKRYGVNLKETNTFTLCWNQALDPGAQLSVKRLYNSCDKAMPATFLLEGRAFELVLQPGACKNLVFAPDGRVLSVKGDQMYYGATCPEYALPPLEQGYLDQAPGANGKRYYLGYAGIQQLHTGSDGDAFYELTTRAGGNRIIGLYAAGGEVVALCNNGETYSNKRELNFNRVLGSDGASICACYPLAGVGLYLRSFDGSIIHRSHCGDLSSDELLVQMFAEAGRC